MRKPNFQAFTMLLAAIFLTSTTLLASVGPALVVA